MNCSLLNIRDFVVNLYTHTQFFKEPFSSFSSLLTHTNTHIYIYMIANHTHTHKHGIYIHWLKAILIFKSTH